MAEPRFLVRASSEASQGYLDIIRAEADTLDGNGLPYEESDVREPFTILVIAIVTAALTTAASETVKRIISRICDRAENDKHAPAGEPPPIQVVINNFTFALPEQRGAAGDAVDALVQ